MNLGTFISAVMLVLNGYVIARDVAKKGEFRVLTFTNFLFYAIVALPIFLSL